MVDLLDDLRALGFDKSFRFSEGKLVCVDSGRSYAPHNLETDAIYRFEGPSNPGDMSVVYVLRADDGTKGVFIDAFGPEGDAQAGEFLSEVPDIRSHGED